MNSLKRLFKSFRYSLEGIRYIWEHEQNFRIQTAISVVVLIGMFIFQVSISEAIVLIMLIIFVLVLEVANTILEKMVDVLKPRMHTYVKVIKDMMAGAVFIAATGSAIISAIIFIPHLLEWF